MDPVPVRPARRRPSSLFRSLSATMLATGLAVGLVLGGGGAWISWRNEQRRIEESAAAIANVNLPRIVDMLWEMSGQVEDYVEAMLNLPYVSSVELVEPGSRFMLEKPDPVRLEYREYPIRHSRGLDLGTLVIGFDLGRASAESARAAGLYALFLGAMLLASGLVQWLFFRRRIADPLDALARHAQGMTLDTLDSAFPYGGGDDDELSRLAASFNGMSRNLMEALDERHALQEELWHSEERYREVFDSVGDAIFLHDADSLRVLEVNRSAEELFGMPRGQLSAEGSIERIAADEIEFRREIPAEVMRRCRSEGQLTLERRCRHTSGRVFWAELLFTPVTIAGEPRIIVSIRDIEARKRAEQEALHLQKMESLGLLAGGIAHDFNNILQAIVSNADIGLLDAAGTPSEPHFAAIRDAALRSSTLTRRLLAFARKQVVQPRTVDLDPAVEGTMALLRRLLPGNVGLDWRPSGSAPRVFIDPSHVDQILTNLVVNARDAMDGDGRIVVGTALAALRPGEPGVPASAKPGRYAVLTVRDDGRGMTDGVLSRIFEPFFTTKPPGKGTGLGLSTVFGIVGQGGGFIDVTSAPGAGTTVRVCLPLDESDAPSRSGEEG